MGRYAFFNTGLEYKFGYGVQSSMDMTLFGGIERLDSDEPVHEWSTTDIPKIQKALCEMETAWDIVPVDFADYPKMLAGTLAMKLDLLKDAFEPLEIFYKYRLGCLILHQLSYEPALSVRYEL